MPFGDVAQHAGQPDPARGTTARPELGGQPRGRGPSPLHDVGQHPEGLQVGGRAARHLDGGVVVAQPRRSERPHRPLVEPVDPLDAYAGRRQDRAGPGHRHLDGRRVRPLARPLVRAQRGLARQRGRPRVQHRRPRPLDPGGLPGVVDVDPGVHDRQRRGAGSSGGCWSASRPPRGAGPGPRRPCWSRRKSTASQSVGQGCAEVIWPSFPLAGRLRPRDRRLWTTAGCGFGATRRQRSHTYRGGRRARPRRAAPGRRRPSKPGAASAAGRRAEPGRPQPQAGAAGSGAGTPTVGMPSPTPGPVAAGAAVRASQASPARVRRTDRTGPSATRWCGAA